MNRINIGNMYYNGCVCDRIMCVHRIRVKE